jgi:hypothetical protein
MPHRRQLHIKKLKNSKETKMLLIFLGLSFLFWMLIKLSKEYTDTVQLKIEYRNLPEGKMLVGNTSNMLDVTVQTYGFELIKYHLVKKKVAIDLSSLKKNKKAQYYKLSKDLLPEVEKQIASEINVVSIKPDSLYFTIGISKSKEVKIVPDLDIEYSPGYNLLGSLKLEPEKVKIYGPDHLIDSINQISTEHKELKNINSDIDIKLNLIELDESSKVTYSVKEVKVVGSVEKFTEARLKLALDIINLPQGYQITTFPGEVELIFNIGLSDYSKINDNDFKVVCDYQKTEKNELSYLLPELVSKPSIVSDVKIVPSKIDYLIKQ